MTRQDAADLLGVGVAATPAQVQAAYRELSRRFHPDGGGTASQFVLLQRARDVLLRPASAGALAGSGAPALRPLMSYPVRLSIAAVNNERLRPKALRTWGYVAVGLPAAYFAARDLLDVLWLPLLLVFLLWAVWDSRS